MKKKILLISENKQEYEDLIFLITYNNLSDRYNFVLFTTHQIFNLPAYHDSDLNPTIFSKVYHSQNRFSVNFKTVPVFQKLLLIFSNGLKLRRIISSENIDIILSGVPLIFTRVAIFGIKKIDHIAYIRSLLFFSLRSTSISDNVFFFAQRLPVLKKIRFIKNYYADIILTVSDLNKWLLIERSIPEENILICGPIGLRKSDQKKNTSLTNLTHIVFVTQAYKWHRDVEGEKDQIHTLESICTIMEKKYKESLRLIIRVHPRDEIRQYHILKEKYSFISEINEASLPDFLTYAGQNKILVSGLSTLAFEWMYFNGTCYFFSTPYLDRTIKPILSWLNLEPEYDFDILLEKITKGIKAPIKTQIKNLLYRPENQSPVELASFMIDKYINRSNQ